MKGANKTPEHKLQYHREYYKKWLARPGNKEKVKEYSRKALKKWLSKPENVEKQKQAHRNWINKNLEYDAICKSPHARWERGHWHTDHDHETNVIRGILCNECNIGIGKFGDDPAMLHLAIEYLQRFRKD